MTDKNHQEHVDDILEIVDTAETETGTTINVDEAEIADRLDKFVQKRMEPEDGVRVIAKEIIRDAGEDPYKFVRGSGTGRQASGSNEQLVAGDIEEEGRWIAFEGTVIDLNDPNPEGMIQTGRLADDTGSIRFTIWETSDGQNPIDISLEIGESYRVNPVVTNLYEEAEQMELNFREVSEVTKLEGDDALDIDPDTYTETVSGTIIDFQDPMGLVDRCPNNDCGRVVKQRDHCPDCGDIEAEIDLRTKAILDDGEATWVIILDADQTAQEANLTLEDAEELVREHNDRNVVDQYIEAQLHGEYLHVHGMNHGRNFSVESTELIEPPSVSDLATIREHLMELP
ncbi:hypothetical protein [Haloarcula sp. K1]|jgi:replication factor A1|uniref:hypothetical protein n=1 Tax=Haloarcula sp. K1 TaxID=1622207 RepID=UPI0007BB169D|nr:hypothetical protein [Haloarcula sp. K1]KZX46252.1 hypothetical protein AV929_15890 [Haloarcula sp. K1]